MKHSGPAAVYRHIGEEGRVLYIGCSVNPFARTSAHRTTSEWFEQIKSIDLEWYNDQGAALAAERKAIKSEKPPFNKEWQSAPYGPWRANEAHIYLSQWLANSGTTAREFAKRLGVSTTEAKRLSSEVHHVRIKKAADIAVVTGGHVPIWSWNAPRTYRSDYVPIIRPPTEQEAADELSYATRLIAGWAAQEARAAK